jgi:hypothetical protein
MNARQPHMLPPHLVGELSTHLRRLGNRLSVEQAAALAIRAWIAANAPAFPASSATPASAAAARLTPVACQPASPPAPRVPAPTPGYQWKDLFLPEGTALRMSTRDGNYHACVVGHDIIFQGRSVSPRGMTLAICGQGRNAWRDLWIKFPGERFAKPARRCRRDNALADTVPAGDPVDQLSCATIAMSEALSTMLALIDRVTARGEPDPERRSAAARRADDIMADDCAFD